MAYEVLYWADTSEFEQSRLKFWLENHMQNRLVEPIGVSPVVVYDT